MLAVDLPPLHQILPTRSFTTSRASAISGQSMRSERDAIAVEIMLNTVINRRHQPIKLPRNIAKIEQRCNTSSIRHKSESRRSVCWHLFQVQWWVWASSNTGFAPFHPDNLLTRQWLVY